MTDAGLVGLATLTANTVNNLPALLMAVDGTTQVGWGTWTWLLGVNIGAVLLPLGALANLLWLHIIASEEGRVGLGRSVRAVVPVAMPSLAAAALTLAAERLVTG